MLQSSQLTQGHASIFRYFDTSTRPKVDTPIIRQNDTSTFQHTRAAWWGSRHPFVLFHTAITTINTAIHAPQRFPRFGQMCRRPAPCPLKRELLRNQESSFPESLLDALDDVSLLAANGQVAALQKRLQGGHGETLQLPQTTRQGRGGGWGGVEGGYEMPHNTEQSDTKYMYIY